MIINKFIVGIAMILLLSVFIIFQQWRINQIKEDLIKAEQMVKIKTTEIEILSDKITKFKTIDEQSKIIVRKLKPNESLSPVISNYINIFNSLNNHRMQSPDSPNK